MLFSAMVVAILCATSCQKETAPLATAGTEPGMSSGAKTVPVTILMGTKGAFDEECLCCVYIDEYHINCQMITVICESIEDVSSVADFTALVGENASSVGSYFRGDEWKQWYPRLDNEPVLSMLQNDECVIVNAASVGSRRVYQAVDSNDTTNVFFSFCFDVDDSL